MKCFREEAPRVALPDSTTTQIRVFFFPLIQNCPQSGKSKNKWQVEKHSSSGTLLFTVLNSVGKETPVYLGDNGMRKEGSPSLFLFHLQLMAKTCICNNASIPFNCFTATRDTNWLIQHAWIWLWWCVHITMITKIQCRISSCCHFFFPFCFPLWKY